MYLGFQIFAFEVVTIAWLYWDINIFDSELVSVLVSHPQISDLTENNFF